MVTVNFTLIVEVVLFLIFLWGANKLILRPTLDLRDAREEKVDSDFQEAQKLNAEAKRLQREYEEALREARRNANAALQQARREALQARMKRLKEAKEQGDREVMDVQEQMRAMIREQRRQFDQLTPDLAYAMARSLSLEEVLS